MRPYESLIIFDAELEEPAIAGVLDRVTELVRNAGGERNQLDRWGKRAFAYEMKHRREGYYVVMEYTAEPATASEIDRLLDLADEVLRHKTMRLPEKLGRRSVKPQESRATTESPRSRAARVPDAGSSAPGTPAEPLSAEEGAGGPAPAEPVPDQSTSVVSGQVGSGPAETPTDQAAG